MHLTSSPVDWYAARAAGLAAYLLLTVVVSLGLGLAGKKRLERWPRFALEDVHRWGGILVGTFVGIHVLTVAIDSYLPFSLGSLIVPLTGRYRPLWVGLGIVAAELLVAIAVTNRLRDRLPYRTWRRIHYLNFAVWTGATLHGIGAGTDRSTPWAVPLYALASGLVLGLLAARLRRRSLAPLAGLAGAAGVAGLALGPLAFHARPWNPVAFHDTLDGQVQRDLGPTRGLISLTATGEGEQRVLVRADLLIAPRRLDATAFQMELLPSGLVCVGRVTHVESFGFDGTCKAPDGSRRAVVARWSSTPGSGFSGGTLDSRAA